MPEPSREDYLHELDAVLPFPDERRREIVEEIAAHLDDAMADGLSEAAAQRRLGDPTDLARELATPEQSAWRVLVGVGAAVRSGIGHWLYGYLLGSLLVLCGALGATALVQLLGSWLGTGWSLQTVDGGWNSMLTALAAALGLYYAGRVIPGRVARASHRLEGEVRPWAVVATTAVTAGITILLVDAPQNWWSVIAFTLAPGAVALGAYRPRLLPAGLRAYAAVAVVALFVPVALLTLGGGGASGEAQDAVQGPPDRNLSHIGPSWPVPVDGDGVPAIQAGGWSADEDGVTWTATFEPGALRNLRDLRLEAWHTDWETLAIDRDFDAPFATADPVRSGGTLTAMIVTSSEPGVTSWDLVLTGIGPDGVRHVVAAGSGGQSTFTGSVWDWLTAVIGR